MHSPPASRPPLVDRPGWGDLGPKARAWRVAHAAWSVAQLASLGYLWRSAILRRRDRRDWLIIGLLAAEGGALVIGRGNCPMGRLQEAWGDPVPFFELLLPPRAAKAAVPILAVVSLLGIGLVLFRGPRRP